MTKSREAKRKAENKELVNRMRQGDRLSSFSAWSSWFPPRPLIKKDQAAIEKLKGGK